LSDGTIVSLQDREEKKTIPSSPPTSIPRNFTHQGYWLKAGYFQSTLSNSTTVDTFSAINFQAGSINNFASFAAVFDTYCIVAAVVRIRPEQAQSTSSLSNPGLLITAIDHDDLTAVTSSVMREYPSVLETEFTQGQTRVVYPRIALAAYTGSFNGYMNARGYIDTASGTVQHYGLKILVGQSTYLAQAECTVDLIVHFRDGH
jgi:hypothetical protein